MSAEGFSPHEIEQERQKQVRELAAESGPDWAEGYRPGTAGCHELLDRTALVVDVVERHLRAHPACIARPEWYQLAVQAVATLNELYQQVEAEHLPDDQPAE